MCIITVRLIIITFQSFITMHVPYFMRLVQCSSTCSKQYHSNSGVNGRRIQYTSVMLKLRANRVYVIMEETIEIDTKTVVDGYNELTGCFKLVPGIG
jgi:hypothetical protein